MSQNRYERAFRWVSSQRGALSFFPVPDLSAELVQVCDAPARSSPKQLRASGALRTNHCLQLVVLVEMPNETPEVAVARSDNRAIVFAEVDHRLKHKVGVDIPLWFAGFVIPRHWFEDQYETRCLQAVVEILITRNESEKQIRRA